jgi:hypothetical protein
MLLYIDASSGGMMLQVLLSGAVGGIVFFKLAASRFVDIILRRKPEAAIASDDAIEDADLSGDDAVTDSDSKSLAA